MGQNSGKNTGWHIAGLTLTGILILGLLAVLILGFSAFDTADYPFVGDVAVYPSNNEEILPRRSAAVVRRDGVLRRGVPVAYYDTEKEYIQIKYYYGEENETLILTNGRSEDVTEISMEQLRGVVTESIPMLGAFLNRICTLSGICISLVVALLLIFVWILIFASVLRIRKCNRETEAMEEPFEQVSEETEDALLETEETAKPQTYTVEQLEDLPEGFRGVVFHGTVDALMKLSLILRMAAEKRAVSTLQIQELYDEPPCALCVTAPERDFALVSAVVAMLKEREK